MKANEILKAAEMFARVKEMLLTTKVHNEYHPDGDYLFVFCRKNSYYTNSFCDIMESHDLDRKEDYYSLKTVDETAAKFVELALASGANNMDDFYLGY